MDMPERIFAHYSMTMTDTDDRARQNFVWDLSPSNIPGYHTEYVRADLVEAKDARIAELEAEVERAFRAGFVDGVSSADLAIPGGASDEDKAWEAYKAQRQEERGAK